MDGGAGADILEGYEGNDDLFHRRCRGRDLRLPDRRHRRGAHRVSYALDSAGNAAIEVLRTTANGATTAINLIGNEIGQTIIGNAAATG